MIKTCPICGSEAKVENGFSPMESINYVFCTNKKCPIHTFDVYHNMIDVNTWNNRFDILYLFLQALDEDDIPAFEVRPEDGDIEFSYIRNKHNQIAFNLSKDGRISGAYITDDDKGYFDYVFNGELPEELYELILKVDK